MPVLDGLELYKRMREIDKSAQVMLLTASHAQLQIDNNYRLTTIKNPKSIFVLILLENQSQLAGCC